MGRYYEGYSDARRAVVSQGLDEDLALLDNLFGRDALAYGASPADVKAEALRQLEREWTDPTWVNSPDGRFVADVVAELRKAR